MARHWQFPINPRIMARAAQSIAHRPNPHGAHTENTTPIKHRRNYTGQGHSLSRKIFMFALVGVSLLCVPPLQIHHTHKHVEKERKKQSGEKIHRTEYLLTPIAQSSRIYPGTKRKEDPHLTANNWLLICAHVLCLSFIAHQTGTQK